MRYFIEIAYNGGAYHGWQRQPNAISVQEVLEKAISMILRQEITTTAAGRTDTGVHAIAMCCHFDYDEQLDSNFIQRLNSLLPNDIAANKICKVTADAHARFSAIKRTYQYHVITKKSPFHTQSALRVTRPLNVEAMNQAAAKLLTYNDFQSFSKVHTDVNNFICKVEYAKWERVGDELIFTITANRFLRNMVRAIVGTLLDVGYGKITIDQFCEIIEKKDRCSASESIAAHGLFFVNAQYDNSIYII